MITYGTNPGMGMPITAPVPDPDVGSDPSEREALDKALRYMALQPGKPLLGHPVDVVFLGSCTNSRIVRPAQAARVLRGRKVAPERANAGRARLAGVKRQAEAEGLDKVFSEAGAEWREAGCSMCIAMNGDQLAARPVRGQHKQSKLRGTAGKGRPNVPRQPADGRRQRRDRRGPDVRTLL